MNFLTISIPEINVPIDEKTFANSITNNVLVTLFFQKPLNVSVSAPRSSKSFTFGFLTLASTMPANQPDANRGFREVIGAITNEVSIDNGWPSANNVPKADKEPFHSTHDFN